MAEQNNTQSETFPRQVIGKVVSNKMNKTIIVEFEQKVKHPLYGKYVRHFTKMVAHDEDNASQPGDTVLIRQTRPLSKTKRWTLVEILQKEEE